MRRLLILASAWALVLHAPARSQQAPAAATPTYNIELLVFRATTAAGGGEDWSVQAGKRSFSGNGELSASGSGPAAVGRFVRTLPAAQHQLQGVAAKLRASGRYEPVAHVAWSQTPSAWGSRAGFPVQRLGIDVPGLTGMVYLERGRFLHLGLALDYAMPTPPAGLGAGPGTTFTLSEIRRIRFNERNYYDHPAFGVIAVVTPAQSARPPAAR